MLTKFIIPLDRYGMDSSLPADEVRQRLQAVTDTQLPLVSMPDDAAAWQGRVAGDGFKIRHAIKSLSRGRGYSAIVNIGWITPQGTGCRITVWQRYSIVHMTMMLVMIALGLALARPDLGHPIAFLPAGLVWLVFLIAFHVGCGSQRAALAALVAGD